MRWLIPGRVAGAAEGDELPPSIATVVRLGRASPLRLVGRNPGGPWRIGLPLRSASRPSLQEVQNVVDLLRYEGAMGRAVALISRPGWLTALAVECLALAEGRRRRPTCRRAAWYAVARRRDGEMALRRRGGTDHPLLRRTLVHTTTAEAMALVVSSGALLSAAARRGRAGGRGLGGVLLGEPVDYDDYVMFGPPSAIGGELVANSQRLNRLWDPSALDDYLPGVRLYFHRATLERLPGATFDGVHVLKVRGKVPLAGGLLAVASADAAVLTMCASLGGRLIRAKGKVPQDYVCESNRLLVVEAAGG
jgi:hypothetical protein